MSSRTDSTACPALYPIHDSDSETSCGARARDSRTNLALGRLLDQLLMMHWLPRDAVERVWSAEELPQPLARNVRRLPPSAAWRAYIDGSRLWFAIGRAGEAPFVRPRASALEISFSSEGSKLVNSGAWEYSAAHGWQPLRAASYTPRGK